MITSDIVDYRLLNDLELAAVIQLFRKEKGWTQETLAELARVSVRTVQRLEDGQPSSGDTRRAIANAFALADLDIFSKPWPLPNIEKLKEETARIERETVTVEVQRMANGRQLRDLAEQVDSFLFMPIDEPSDEVETLLASLQEYFVEYGDCHDLYSPTDKLEVNRYFQGKIDELTARGTGIAYGCRRVRLRFGHPKPDDRGETFNVGYIVSGPVDALPQLIRVPRNDRFGF